MNQEAAVNGAGGTGKSKGKLLSKAAPKAKSKVAEAELIRKRDLIRPEDVLSLEVATEGVAISYVP